MSPIEGCPEKKDTCPCQEFSKEGLCDWPYQCDMTIDEIKHMTELLRVVERSPEENHDSRER